MGRTQRANTGWPGDQDRANTAVEHSGLTQRANTAGLTQPRGITQRADIGWRGVEDKANTAVEHSGLTQAPGLTQPAGLIQPGHKQAGHASWVMQLANSKVAILFGFSRAHYQQL